MAVPEKRKSRNIRKSILKWFKDSFVTVNSIPAANVDYRDRTFDPSGLDYWVGVEFLSDGAGRKDATMAQFGVYSRVGGRLSGGDRYGDTMDDLADKLHDALHDQTVQIYDYSSSPSSPSAVANAVLIVQNSEGVFREPEDDKTFGPGDDGVMWRVLTYRFIFLGDLSGASQYYD